MMCLRLNSFILKKVSLCIIMLYLDMNIKYLLKEIEALMKLDHPKIIKLETYFFLEQEESIALILEYVNGGTLKEFLKEQSTLSEDIIRPIIKQILEALAFCHGKEIVHRDLKLENIMFDSKERTNIKLIDFGIAGIFQEVVNAGSLKYLPPEVINNTDNESKPSIDCWATGCITYELLFGKRLFSGNNQSEIKNNINKELIILANSISKEACNFLTLLLKKQPNERMTINEALIHPWILGSKLDSKDEVDQNSKSLSPVKKTRKPNKSISIITPITKSIHNNNGNINFADMLRSRTIEKNDNYVKQSSNALQTKVNSDTSNYKIYDISNQLAKEYGKIPTFLQPIGNSKEQKNKFIRLRESIISHLNLQQGNSDQTNNISNKINEVSISPPKKGRDSYKLKITKPSQKASKSNLILPKPIQSSIYNITSINNSPRSSAEANKISSPIKKKSEMLKTTNSIISFNTLTNHKQTKSYDKN